MSDVFISYKRRLRPRVEKLAIALRALKLSVWYDAGLAPGHSFSDEISHEVRTASAVLVCWTNDCFGHGGDETGWVRAEAEIGRSRGALVSVLMEPTQLDPPWNIIHNENLIGWARDDGLGTPTDPAWMSVLTALGEKTNRPGLAAYVPAYESGKAAPLKAWAQEYPDDPLAPDAWSRVEALEVEEAKARVARERETRPLRPSPAPKADPDPYTRSPMTLAREPATPAADPHASVVEAALPPRWRSMLVPGLLVVIAGLLAWNLIPRGTGVPAEPPAADGPPADSAAEAPGDMDAATAAAVSACRGFAEDALRKPGAMAPCQRAAKAKPDDGDLAGRYALATWWETKDSAKARPLFERAANLNDPRGQHGLGLMHRDGEGGLSKNFDEAVRYFRLAASQGFAPAQTDMGLSHEFGEGAAQDLTEAARWYRLAADQGFATAQTNLGFLYEYGRGVSLDLSEAARWYRKAADQGHPRGQARLGELYRLGRGVSKDLAEAVRYLRLAADQGYSYGQYQLGGLYARGEGVDKNPGEAVRYYRMAAEQGLADAQNDLGIAYHTGEGVTVDYGQAAMWYRRAAEQKHMHGQFNLGLLYEAGLGLTRDYGEAARLFSLASEQGHPGAPARLGLLHENGTGVTADPAEAARLYRLSADRGDAGGQASLAAMYETGKGGLPRDLSKAIRYYRLAAAQGNEFAKKALARLGVPE